MRFRSSDEMVVGLGAGLILAGVAGIILASILGDSFMATVIGHFSGISLGAGLVDLLVHFTMLKRLVKQVSDQVAHSIRLPLEEFYQSRHELPRFEHEFRGASEIWLAWHVGSIQGTGTLTLRDLPCASSRLLLTHPDSTYLEGLAKILGRSKSSIRSNILELTRMAKECLVEVRWFDGPLGSSMVIIDPRSPSGWARLELLIPYGRPPERPSFRVSMGKGQSAFRRVIEAYERVWNNAEDVPASTLSGMLALQT